MTTPGEISSHRGQVRSALPTTQRGETLRDPGNRVAVTQDLKRHLQALKIIHGHQDRFGLPVAGQGDSFMLEPHSPGQVGEVRLRLGDRDRSGCRYSHGQNYSWSWSEFKPL